MLVVAAGVWDGFVGAAVFADAATNRPAAADAFALSRATIYCNDWDSVVAVVIVVDVHFVFFMFLSMISPSSLLLFLVP